jgi:hypothetical protein
VLKRIIISVECAVAVGAALAIGAGAGRAATAPATAAQYRTQVNALCRSYTPKLKQVEGDMARAKAAGNGQVYLHDFGVLVGMSLVEGRRVERAPLPQTGAAVFVKPLRLLHAVDGHLQQMIGSIVAGDGAGLLRESAALSKIAAPLNPLLDAAGLRDCGSNQT